MSPYELLFKCPACGSGPDSASSRTGWTGWTECWCGRLRREGSRLWPRRFAFLHEGTERLVIGAPSNFRVRVLLSEGRWEPGDGTWRLRVLSDDEFSSFIREVLASESLSCPEISGPAYAAIHASCPFCRFSGVQRSIDRWVSTTDWKGWTVCGCGRLLVGPLGGVRKFVLLQAVKDSPLRLVGTPDASSKLPYVMLCEDPWSPAMGDPRHGGRARPVAPADLGVVLQSFISEALVLEVMSS